MKCVSILYHRVTGTNSNSKKNKRNKCRISLGHFKIHFDRGEVYRDSFHIYNEPSTKRQSSITWRKKQRSNSVAVWKELQFKL